MLCDSALKWQETPDSGPLDFQSFVRRVRGSLNTAFIALVASLDRLVMAASDFAAEPQQQRVRIDAALWPNGKFLSDCSNLLDAFDGVIQPSPAIIASRKTYGLKEVDRWQMDVNGGLHRGPR